MANNWEEKTLGEVVTLKRGYDLPTQDRHPGRFPVVSSSGVTGRHWEAKVKAPGVVTGRYGTLGEVHYIVEDFWPLNTTLYVEDFKGNNPRFISYLLRSLDFQAYSDKSSVPGLNRNHLHAEMVRVPIDLGEQRAIVNILGSLDDKIGLNQCMNKLLVEMARTIFRAWFINFEPVKARAAGGNRFKGMPRATFDQLPDHFVESEFGVLPAGWEYVPIGSLVEASGGGTPSTTRREFWDGGEFNFCTPKDMSRLASPVLLDTERHITQAGVDEISSRQLPSGTVLLSSRAPIGYLAIAQTPVSVNQGIIAMVVGKIPSTYIFFWAESNMETIKSRAGGSTFAEINKQQFRPIPALRPDDRTLTAFADLTLPLFDLIACNEKESALLATMRDALLPRLMSGAIPLPSIEGASDG